MRPEGWRNPYPEARLIGDYLGSDLDKHNIFEAGADAYEKALRRVASRLRR